MLNILFKTQSIKISITSNTTDVVDGDYLNLYGGLMDNPSDIDFDTPLLSNIKPTSIKIDETNPSVPINYRKWDIYYAVSEEGLYQFDYKVFDRYSNPGTITDPNPSDDPVDFSVCLTPKKATTPYDAVLVDDTTLTLSF